MSVFSLINHQGTIQFASGGCSKTFGTEASELIGQQNEALIDSVDRDTVRSTLESALKAGQGMVSLRYRRVDKRGNFIPVGSFVCPSASSPTLAVLEMLEVYCVSQCSRDPYQTGKTDRRA
jgi:PAS domain S-box-containing protein